eukprot:tig00020675_g12603.t1
MARKAAKRAPPSESEEASDSSAAEEPEPEASEEERGSAKKKRAREPAKRGGRGSRSRGASRGAGRGKGRGSRSEEREEASEEPPASKPSKRRPARTSSAPAEDSAVHVKQEEEDDAERPGEAEGSEAASASSSEAPPTPRKQRTPARSKKAEAISAQAAEEQYAIRLSLPREQSRKLVGAHVSKEGGADRAVLRMVCLGGRALALFTRQKMSWKSPALKEDEIARFKSTCARFGVDPAKHIVVHGMYLINSGTPDDDMLSKSREAMADELRRCDALGIGMWTYHPGSAMKQGRGEAHARVAESVRLALDASEKVRAS